MFASVCVYACMATPSHNDKQKKRTSQTNVRQSSAKTVHSIAHAITGRARPLTHVPRRKFLKLLMQTKHSHQPHKRARTHIHTHNRIF